MTKYRRSEIISLDRDKSGRYVPVRRHDADPDDWPVVELAPQQQRTGEVITGDHVTRAKAFLLRTSVLSVITSIAVMIFGSIIARYPLLSVTAIITALFTLVVVFIGAHIIDSLMSPAGIDFLDNWRWWRYMMIEQRERHRRMREMQHDKDV